MTKEQYKKIEQVLINHAMTGNLEAVNTLITFKINQDILIDKEKEKEIAVVREHVEVR